MDRELNDLLSAMEQLGRENDTPETDRRCKLLNLERDPAALVHILVAAGSRHSVLEIGTSNGYSTLSLAYALRSRPADRITSIERDAMKVEMARENLQRAGLGDRVTLMHGDASEVVKTLPGPFDCVLFDASRTSAPGQLHTLLPKLAANVMLLCDNILSHPAELADYLSALERLRDFISVTVPIGKGLHIAFRDAPEVTNNIDASAAHLRETSRSRANPLKSPRPVPARPRRADAVRISYDTLAPEYARRIYAELKDKPFDREWLDRFAKRVHPIGPVCDLGCGPGHVARYLRDRGLDVFGLDLSPGMLTEARRLNPDIEFIEGTMLSLNLASDSLGGVASLYSIIHLNRRELSAAFAEMFRVLRPGGCAVLAFHLGWKKIHNTKLWGYSVDLRATFFTTREVLAKLERAGFRIEAALERDPYPDVEYQSRRSYILAGKPTAMGTKGRLSRR